jgi:hypothetical protein
VTGGARRIREPPRPDIADQRQPGGVQPSPIPILDGGQILVNILEAMKGSAFSAKTRDNILRAGLATVLLLFALVTYNDLRRLVVSLIEKFG